MTITNQQILRKIIAECEQALKNEEKVREHAKAVQALTDLLLEYDVPTASPTINELEWKKMVGHPAPKPVQKQAKQTASEETQSDSLLDF
ncbi:DUF5327 family protein [Gracilibacillus alcaliphilus]|uniref:DUF5327 family protein n=1 Tax=Gracilibacillus alcaliphilus TaxID=1401441 RepID=UPI00195CA99A|nr:DUF5327 family protein [Gracilibacillus alcaliphilus]MBM7677253.1 hypothetical protein [Gracilibacillus alcaliphilus]